MSTPGMYFVFTGLALMVMVALDVTLFQSFRAAAPGRDRGWALVAFMFALSVSVAIALVVCFAFSTMRAQWPGGGL